MFELGHGMPCPFMLKDHLDAIHRMTNGNNEPVLDNCGGWNDIQGFKPEIRVTKLEAVLQRSYCNK